MKILKHLSLITLCTFTPVSSVLAKVEAKLSPFVTDGCTLFVNGTKAKPDLWRHCCVDHDLRFWFGGSQEDMDKTDLRLKECVQKVAGDTWANLIYNGVRAGHYSPIKNKYQWSWGWNPKRGKKSLTNEESIQVINEIKNLNLPEVKMEEFIKFHFPNQTAL